MAKDLHKKPFDEGTKAKLAIFEDYLKEWLPVFISKKEIFWKNINIYDFFAGPGCDVTGVKGTPLLILDELENHLYNIRKKGLIINLYFNEYDSKKYQELVEHIKDYDINDKPYKIELDNLEFKDAYNKKALSMGKFQSANLVFLDQNGIKHITEGVFRYLINVRRTDFLFFMSSSTIKRFCDHPNIIQHIKLSPEEVEKTHYYQIHKLVLEFYQSLVPANKEMYLAPFSLMKKPNIYGLIFGSTHVLGMEKFLKTCWKMDKERGEANFDIDNDKIKEGQVDLFTGELTKPKKVEFFEKDLAEKICNSELKNDKEVYLFTITNGFLPSHANGVLNTLINRNRIEKSQFNISSTICKLNASLSLIKLK